MGATPGKTDEGVPIVICTPKPFGYTTYFSGAGDDLPGEIIGAGDRLVFRMEPANISKQVTLKYTESVYIKDGYIIFTDAPLGSYIDAEVLAPNGDVVAAFGRKIPMLGTGRVKLDTNDSSKIQVGYSLKITVYNSAGLGDQESASTFRVVGMLEMYRINT